MSEQAGQPTPEEILAAAERYAKAGLKIYPVRIPGLKPDGKKDVRPLVKSWYDATDDLGQVRAWWGEQFPGAGIGVDMGASRLAVADGDTHDGGVERLLEFLEPGQGHLSRTASGGVHVWFRDPDGTVGTGSNILGDKDHPSGVDARGVGGTIFMPPTHVPGYGTYSWGPEGEPDWSALPEVPAKLAAACPPGGRKKSAESVLAAQPLPAVTPDSPFMTPEQAIAAAGPGAGFVHRDRVMTREAASEKLRPLWEAIRDTKPPNGLWQAVADFARAAAHYQCWWSQADVEGMVLAAYAAGGHGYEYLDRGDLRAISGGFRLQQEARDEGDLDDGWCAQPAPNAVPAFVEQVAAGTPEDAVDALLAEIMTPERVKAQPAKKYLIKGLLHLDSESWMIGEPGSRKSFVALDMAAHVAAGKPWQGLRTASGPVLIIAAEGAGGIGSRFQAWELEHGPMPDSVYVLPRPVQAADMVGWGVLVRAAERLKPAMIIVDTQSRVTVGLKENDADQMMIYVAAATALRMATGACVLTIHHTGRNGGDARGSSALDGAQDTELKVVAGKEPLRGELRVEKQKDMAEREPLPLAFGVHVVGVDEDGDPITSLAVRGADVWREAAEEMVLIEDGQEVDVPEPERWTLAAAPHNRATNQRRILQILATVGGTRGITKTEVNRVLRSRWYDSRPMKAKRSGHLSPESWEGAWTAVLEIETPHGEQVITASGGARFTINPVAVSELNANVLPA